MKKYEALTKYIPHFDPACPAGRWVEDTEHQGTPDDPKNMPYVDYEMWLLMLLNDFGKGFWDNDFKQNMAKIDREALQDIEHLSESELLTYFTYLISANRFCDGLLLNYCESGVVLRILTALKKYDEERACV